jgi:hypothetical protein
MSDTDDALARDKEVAAQVTRLLDGLDHAESGFVLVLATVAWLETFRTHDPDRQVEAWAELLTHHVAAVMRMLPPPRVVQ